MVRYYYRMKICAIADENITGSVNKWLDNEATLTISGQIGNRISNLEKKCDKIILI